MKTINGIATAKLDALSFGAGVFLCLVGLGLLFGIAGLCLGIGAGLILLTLSPDRSGAKP